MDTIGLPRAPIPRTYNCEFGVSTDVRGESNGFRLGLLVLVIVLYGAIAPGIAVAQTGASGSVVVGPDETVSNIDAVTGSIVIQGTVTGDVSGLAGNVRIDGTVEGDVDVAAGDVDIRGEVGGDVSAAAGNVRVHEEGLVRGDLTAGAGSVVIDGTIEGSAQIGAETIRLGEQARIGGSLTYDGDLDGNLDAVEGEITRDRSLGVGVFDEVQPFVEWVFAINIFVLNLLLGALLLGFFPRFSDGVAERALYAPVRSGLVGLGVVIAIPLLLIATAITVIGLPITVIGTILFLFLLWVGLIYGRFVLGVWLLSLANIDSRWGGLVVGILFGTLLWQIPVVGGLVNMVLFLLGIGALVSQLVSRRRRLGEHETERPAPAD